MGYRIKVGTRASRLALAQVEEIKQLLPEVSFETVAIETKGDKDKHTPIALVENSDFFTGEIEQVLLKKEIDAAVHSAKDLEENTPLDLIIAAMTESVSRYDCLVSRHHFTLDNLPAGSRVGTSSKNRKEGVLKYRNDLVVKDMRGNVEERLKQLYWGDFDAIVVAHAALIRLGYQALITQIIPVDIIKPHPLQGRLAVQLRKDRLDLIDFFRRIDAS